MCFVIEIPAYLNNLKHLGQLEALRHPSSHLESSDQETVDMIRLISIFAQRCLVDGLIRRFRYFGAHGTDYFFHFFIVGQDIDIFAKQFHRAVLSCSFQPYTGMAFPAHPRIIHAGQNSFKTVCTYINRHITYSPSQLNTGPQEPVKD